MEEVAPFTGAWIEMPKAWTGIRALRRVAPFTGAWIEMMPTATFYILSDESHPSRVRGLKWTI